MTLNFEPGRSCVQQAIKNGKDPAFEKLKNVLTAVCKDDGTPEVDEHNNPKTIFEEADEIIWKKEIDQCVKEKAIYKQNMRKSCTLMWGQCSNTREA